MAYKWVDESKLNAALTASADAIREKTGDTAQINFDMENETGFESAIKEIESGGGGMTKLFEGMFSIDNDIKYGDETQTVATLSTGISDLSFSNSGNIAIFVVEYLGTGTTSRDFVKVIGMNGHNQGASLISIPAHFICYGGENLPPAPRDWEWNMLRNTNYKGPIWTSIAKDLSLVTVYGELAQSTSTAIIVKGDYNIKIYDTGISQNRGYV